MAALFLWACASPDDPRSTQLPSAAEPPLHHDLITSLSRIAAQALRAFVASLHGAPPFCRAANCRQNAKRPENSAFSALNRRAQNQVRKPRLFVAATKPPHGRFQASTKEISMNIKLAVIALAALGSVALMSGSASAMPNGLPQAGHIAGETSNVYQVRQVCDRWGRCHWQPGGYGYHGPRHHGWHHRPQFHHRHHHGPRHHGGHHSGHHSGHHGGHRR